MSYKTYLFFILALSPSAYTFTMEQASTTHDIAKVNKVQEINSENAIKLLDLPNELLEAIFEQSFCLSIDELACLYKTPKELLESKEIFDEKSCDFFHVEAIILNKFINDYKALLLVNKELAYRFRDFIERRICSKSFIEPLKKKYLKIANKFDLNGLKFAILKTRLADLPKEVIANIFLQLLPNFDSIIRSGIDQTMDVQSSSEPVFSLLSIAKVIKLFKNLAKELNLFAKDIFTCAHLNKDFTWLKEFFAKIIESKLLYFQNNIHTAINEAANMPEIKKEINLAKNLLILYAMHYKQTMALWFLLNNDEDKFKALYMAIRDNNKCMIKKLVNSGIDINKADNDGNTVLMNTITIEDIDVKTVKLLVKLGIDLRIRNNKCETVEDIVSKALEDNFDFDLFQIAKILRKANFRPRARLNTCLVS